MTYPIPLSTSEPNQLLVKLSKTGIVPEDTYVYYEIEHFKKTFPQTLSTRERVLKQNRNSTGEGIWRVVVED